jgi:crotonobetainyl-CoA hydratase/dehydration protein DpgD
MLGLDMSLPNAAAASYAWEDRRRRSEDAIEGPRAFAEKREPRWTGR